MEGRTLMRSDKLFLIVALLLVSMGVGYAYFTSPTWVTVAVGPEGSPDDKLLRAFAVQLKEQHVALRLTIKPVADARAAADALDKGEADLAVIRTDVKLPDNGLTLAILRDAAIIVIVPRESGIADLDGIGGKTLGVVANFASDPGLVANVLRQFDTETQGVKVVPVTRDEAVAALKEKRVDAVAMVAPPAGTNATEFVRDLARAYSGQIAILSVESPDAISQRSPILSQATIPEGLWGGRPRQPEKEVKTAAVSYRLMAHADTDRTVVANVVENLFQMRARIAGQARSANFMRAPEMDSSASATSAMLPNHPGSVDYFQRETQSVMDRYGDWIYLFAFFGSGLLSAAAWMVQRFRLRRREVIDDVLDRLLALLSDARAAADTQRLDELTHEVDELLRVAVGHARTGATGAQATSALVLALEGARSAIDDRRREIMVSTGEFGRRPDVAPRLVTVS